MPCVVVHFHNRFIRLDVLCLTRVCFFDLCQSFIVHVYLCKRTRLFPEYEPEFAMTALLLMSLSRECVKVCLVALNELNYFLACILFLPGHLKSRESHFGKTKMSCVSALGLQSNTSLCLICKGDILCGKCVFIRSHYLKMFPITQIGYDGNPTENKEPGISQLHVSWLSTVSLLSSTLFSENRSTHNCRAGATYKAYCNFQPVRGNVFSGLHF